MNARKIVSIVVAIALLAVVIVVVRGVQKNAGTSTSTVPSQTASSTQTGMSTSTAPISPTAALAAQIPLPGTTTADISQWTLYTNVANGYNLAYPRDLIRAVEPDGSISLTFPKNIYFHWPLLDDAKVTITVGPKCPAITAAGLSGDTKPTTFQLNGRNWKRTVGFEVAAGNRYEEIAFDMFQNAICYHISFLNHGSNGAALYVDSPSLIKKYDAQHDADLEAVILILNNIVSTFKVNGLKG